MFYETLQKLTTNAVCLYNDLSNGTKKKYDEFEKIFTMLGLTDRKKMYALLYITVASPK